MDIASTVVVLGFFLALAAKLDELIDKRPSIKNEIVTTINNFSSAKYPEIVKKSNQIFLKIFKLIYEVESIDRNQKLHWSWLIYSFSVILSTGLIHNLLKISIPLEKLLAYLLIIPSAVVIIIHYTEEKELLRFLSLFLISSLVIITDNLLGNPYQDFNHFFTIIVVVPLFIGIFLHDFLGKWDRLFFHISIPRVIFTSIITMTIIAFIKKDIAQTFISDFNQIGMILLAYLLLNIFADSVSLLETNIILKLAAKGKTKKFVFLGLLDLILSTFIFLAIPLSTGNLDIFLGSILFKGDHPWLGILFWSTFSTSFIFWTFLLAIFGQIITQKMLWHYIKLNKILPIEEKPFTCLYLFAMVIIMPFVFLIL